MKQVGIKIEQRIVGEYYGDKLSPGNTIVVQVALSHTGQRRLRNVREMVFDFSASKGIEPKKGTPSSCPMRSPPPDRNTSVVLSQWGHTNPLMFSTIPRIGTLTFWNMRNPRRAMLRLTS